MKHAIVNRLQDSAVCGLRYEEKKLEDGLATCMEEVTCPGCQQGLLDSLQAEIAACKKAWGLE